MLIKTRHVPARWIASGIFSSLHNREKALSFVVFQPMARGRASINDAYTSLGDIDKMRHGRRLFWAIAVLSCCVIAGGCAGLLGKPQSAPAGAMHAPSSTQKACEKTEQVHSSPAPALSAAAASCCVIAGGSTGGLNTNKVCAAVQYTCPRRRRKPARKPIRLSARRHCQRLRINAVGQIRRCSADALVGSARIAPAGRGPISGCDCNLVHNRLQIACFAGGRYKLAKGRIVGCGFTHGSRSALP